MPELDSYHRSSWEQKQVYEEQCN